jgi:rhodanese-related sulfurtransferase
MPRRMMRAGAALLMAALMHAAATGGTFAQGRNIDEAILNEPKQTTGEVSTGEMRRILAEGSAVVLDSRKRSEYAAGHIAGARNVAPDAGPAPASYAAAVEKLVGADKSKALVLYCNGPHCQASRQLSEQLVAAGFTNVRRYQLGIPIWRALSGPVEIELEGVLRIYYIDRTAVFLDARDAEEFTKDSLAGTHNVPAAKLETELRKAPLPNNDFNTRIVIFGRDGSQARAIADALAMTAYQNVSYFPGTYDALAAALRAK